MSEENLIIIGSGPAGYTASIYAARACLNPVLICGNQKGGQLTITTEVENYPGFPKPIGGQWLVDQMEEHAKNVGTRIINDHITSVDFSQYPFFMIGEMGQEYRSKSVIISTGALAKWLGIKGEEEYKGYGVSGCAVCDGTFYRGKNVIVIGGGNTAVSEALYLTNHANKVFLIHRRDQLRAEKMMQSKLFNNKKIEIIWNTIVKEILGDKSGVTGVKMQNVETNEIKEQAIDGVFVAIGHSPSTDIFKDQIAMDHEGYIITKPNSTVTSVSGVFAAGDVQDKIFRQAVTAAGTGCMAALEAAKFLE